MNKPHFCTGHEHRTDNFTVDHPGQASCAALLGEALAPWEGLTPVAFVVDVLQQIAADLYILSEAFKDQKEGEEGPPNNTILRRVIAGIEGRARAASEVVRRLDRVDAGRGAQ